MSEAPAGLVDDGGARHLKRGRRMPDIALPTTRAAASALRRLPGRAVVYCYPWTGRPGLPNPPDWDDIPGAHGSTPQLEGLRDLHAGFVQVGAALFALSTQSTDYQREMAARLRLPFEIVSDEAFALQQALALPTFETGGVRYLKRLTLAIRDGRIERVYYPVTAGRPRPRGVRLARHDRSHALKARAPRPTQAEADAIPQGECPCPQRSSSTSISAAPTPISRTSDPGDRAATGAKFEYVPVLLGGVFKLTDNRSPVEPRGHQEQARVPAARDRRFIARHGLTQFKMNPHFPVNTVRSCAAPPRREMDGVFGRYVDAVFRRMWEEGQEDGRPAGIGAALDQAGLDGARVLARIQDQEIKDSPLKNTEASVVRGTFGSPTFFVGNEIFFGKDRLRDVEEEIWPRPGR